jgi:iron complex outermembrane receptor protein
MSVRTSAAFALILCLSIGISTTAAAEGQGRIEGQVLGKDATPHGGVSVVLRETGGETLTDPSGHYSFIDVPAGSYTLIFIRGEQQATRTGILVQDGETSVINFQSDWDFTFVESLTVYAASRKQERIVEAPAAVTVVSEEQIEREASHGQLPKLLEFTPGAEVTQSGLYDYNFNTRGFNSSLNRRVATLIDGRNPALPFLGAQEWAAVSFPLDDLGGAELVRGPSAALYGANASSGVLNLTTKQPRYSQGGLVRFTGGNIDTANVDFRFAHAVGNDWYVKVTGGVRNSGDFSVSRMGAAEYSVPCAALGQTDCLPQEAAALDPLDDNSIEFGSIRLDKYMDGGGVLTVEGGTANIEGPVFQTGIGRVQVVDAERPWARANYSMDHWNFLASYTARDAPEQTALASGINVALDSSRLAGEVQTNWSFAGDRARLVAGASYSEEEIDSFDPGAVGSPPSFNGQTLMLEKVEEDYQAVFAQLDVQLVDNVKLVVAGRWDDSSIHDAEVSPKASVVWSVRPDHSLRLTYNESFQVANYSEFFLRAFGAPPTSTAALEGVCLFNLVSCGLGNPTPVLALGNKDLDLEQVKTIEIGYSAIISNRTFLTIDYYQSENKDFISDLLLRGSTSLGQINPNIGPWVGPPAAEAALYSPVPGLPPLPPGISVADAVRLLAPDLTTDPLFALGGDGDTVALTYTNLGEVDTEGVDVGVNAFILGGGVISASFSWFDFDIKSAGAGLEDQLSPNSPERKAALGFGQNKEKLDWNVSFRWVDGFRWIVGPFNGDVEAYTTVDIHYNYHFDDNWGVGINVANAFDNVHNESFGGDLLERRALGHVVFNWQ